MEETLDTTLEATNCRLAGSSPSVPAWCAVGSFEALFKSGEILVGREHAALARLRLQLWMWFVGMMVMTLPRHWLGLQGQWRRVANFNYADPIIAGWGPLVIMSLFGAFVLLASAVLFVRNLAVLHRSTVPTHERPLYALAVNPPQHVPAALNGFGLWNVLLLVLMLLAYGYPVAQFVITPSPSAMVHRIN
jgi:cytochrome c oxidase subunit I